MKKLFVLLMLSFLFFSAQAGSSKTSKCSIEIKIINLLAKVDDLVCAGVNLSCGGSTTLCVYNPNGPVTPYQWARAVVRTEAENCGPQQ